MHKNNGHPEPPRRQFLKQTAAVALGAAGVLTPITVGLTALLDPLHSPSSQRRFVKLTTIDVLPEDGSPRRFQVLSERSDAWTRYPLAPIGAVFLRRTGPQRVQAFNVICPHAGCHVDYLGEKKVFYCPCHNSSFALSGAIGDPSSPSPRGLDELEVEVRQGTEVWVRFQNFQTAIREKKALA